MENAHTVRAAITHELLEVTQASALSFDEDENLLETGEIDSLDAAEILMALEEKFGISMFTGEDEEDTPSKLTVNMMLNEIARKLGDRYAQ